MKRFICILVAVILVAASLMGGALATTFGRNFSELKRIVKDNAGSLTVTDYTTDNGTENMIILFETSGTSLLLGDFYLTGTGNKIVVFKLYIVSSYTVSRATALDFCNKWNYDRRYPTIYLDDSDNTFLADGFLFTTSDCSYDMVDEFVSNMIFGAKQLISEMESAGVMP